MLGPIRGLRTNPNEICVTILGYNIQHFSNENDETLVEKYFSPYGTPMVLTPLWGHLTTSNEILVIIFSRCAQHFSA